MGSTNCALCLYESDSDFVLARRMRNLCIDELTGECRRAFGTVNFYLF